MAVVPVCYKMCYKDQTFPSPKEMRQNPGGFKHYTLSQEAPRCFSSVSSHTSRREHVSYNTADISMKTNSRKSIDFSQVVMQSRHSIAFNIKSVANTFSRVPKAVSHLWSSSSDALERKKVCKVSHSLEFNSSEKQLRSLDSYFGKLKNDISRPSSSYLNNSTEFFNRRGQSSEAKGPESVDDCLVRSLDRSGQSEAEEELVYLDKYLAKVNEESKDYVSSASDDESTKAALYAIKGEFGSGVRKPSTYIESKNKDGQGGPKNSSDETSSLHLIGIMASINIAVYLFELASPIRNSDLELFSLPSLYGAKINHLILIGEWWRLVTPMFLVQD